jgi:hypothetical protein
MTDGAIPIPYMRKRSGSISLRADPVLSLEDGLPMFDRVPMGLSGLRLATNDYLFASVILFTCLGCHFGLTLAKFGNLGTTFATVFHQ